MFIIAQINESYSCWKCFKHPSIEGTNIHLNANSLDSLICSECKYHQNIVEDELVSLKSIDNVKILPMSLGNIKSEEEIQTPSSSAQHVSWDQNILSKLKRYFYDLANEITHAIENLLH